MPDYYYSNGDRLPLRRDLARVAVKIDGGVVPGELRGVIGGKRPLAGGIVLVERKRIPDRLLRRLAHEGRVYPVFVDRGVTIVAMPEVRVALNPRDRKSVVEAIRHAPVAAAVIEDGADKLVVRPASGSGDDALRIANHLVECNSRPRVRIVPRPEP
jgi:hypothetical protein